MKAVYKDQALKLAIQSYATTIDRTFDKKTDKKTIATLQDKCKKLIKIVEKLLDWRAIIGESLSKVVTADKYLELVEILLKNNTADLRAAIHSAVCGENDNIKVRRLLISKRAHCDCAECLHHLTYELAYPLHDAADVGDIGRVQALARTDQSKINEQDTHKIMPLHYAAARGHERLAHELCKALAISSLGTDFDLIPLHCAAFGGHIPVIQMLLQYDMDADQKHGTISMANILGLTPLHAAIMSGKVDAALLLLKEGADLEVLSKRGWKPLDYSVCHPKSCKYFLPQTTIDDIIQQHAIPSGLEDRPTETITLKQLFANLPMQCEIIPSLQQVRTGDELTSYGGYYALYNALSLLKCNTSKMPAAVSALLIFGDFERCNRKKFNQFFEWALISISQMRKMGSLGYLLAPELRLLIATLSPQEPIVVLEKSKLKAIADGEVGVGNAFKDVEGPTDDVGKKQLAEEQSRELDLLRRFTRREINRIILIAGVGANHGHWITIDAQRNQDGQISVIAADSMRLINDWRRDLSLSINNILPFYLVLHEGIDHCKELFTKSMQQEIFEEFKPEELAVKYSDQSIAPIESNKLIFAIKALHMHQESIFRLKETLQQILNVVETGRIDEHNRLLMRLSIERFKRSSDVLVACLLRSRLKLDVDSSYQKRLQALEVLFIQDPKNADDINIYASLISILNIERFDRDMQENIAQKLHKVITKLHIMQPMVSGLETSLSDQSDADGQQFFNAVTAKLSKEQIAFMLKYVPIQLRGLIGAISANKPLALRMLLFGPPGNGKTTLPQVIAQACNRPFYIIRVASTGNSYQFSQEKDFKSINDYLAKHPNAVILLDEIDCAFTDKKENDKAAKGLCDLIKAAKDTYPLAVVIATTNCDPQYEVDHSVTRDESGNKQFPAALKSLFSQNVFKIDNPKYEQRKVLIDYFVKQLSDRLNVTLSEQDKAEIARITRKFSIRDLESMFAQAEQLLMIPQGTAFIAGITKDGAPPASGPQAIVAQDQVINMAIIVQARNIVYQSIITKRPWKKQVADAYHVAEKTLHLISQFQSCIHPFIQFQWRMQDQVRHDKERAEGKQERQETEDHAIRREQTLHNASHPISEQLEFVNGEWRHVAGYDHESRYAWINGAWRRVRPRRNAWFDVELADDINVSYPNPKPL